MTVSPAEEVEEPIVSLKINTVTIHRPWLDPKLLHYKSLGLMGLKSASWSSGQLDSKTNNGTFPLLPIAMVVAKDIKISTKSFSKMTQDKLNEAATDKSAKVGIHLQMHYI